MLKRTTIMALALLALISCASPGRAPIFDVKGGDVSVLVVTSSPGGSYPIPEECLDGDVFCLRYPIWFTATAVERVFGPQPRHSRFRAILYTHYDQPAPDSAENPRLMLFLRSGGDIFAIEHMHESVFRRKDGSYVVPLTSSLPIHWLPCELHELRERIDPGDFEADITVPAQYVDEEDLAGAFEMRAGRAVPRYGLAVAKLRSALGGQRGKLSDFNCPMEDER